MERVKTSLLFERVSLKILKLTIMQGFEQEGVDDQTGFSEHEREIEVKVYPNLIPVNSA